MTFPAFEPDPFGSLDQKCAWMRTRHERKPGKKHTVSEERSTPRLHIGRTGKDDCFLSASAVKVLTGEGEQFAYVIVRDNKIVFEPLPFVEGAVTVVRLDRRPRGRKGLVASCKVSISKALSKLGIKLSCDLYGSWDEAESVMVFEVRK